MTNTDQHTMLYPAQAAEKSGLARIIEQTSELAQTIFGQHILQSEQIITDVEKAEEKLSLMREMLHLFRGEESLYIETVYDIESAMKQTTVEGFSLQASDLFKIGISMKNMRSVRTFLTNREETYPKLAALSKQLPPKMDIEQRILKSVNKEGDVLDAASPELQSIRRSIEQTQRQARSALQKRMRKAIKDNMAIEEGLTIRNGRLVMPIKAEFKRQINGLIHDVSATGQTVYVEPSEVLPLNNEVRSLEVDEQREVERILRALTKALAPEVSVILGSLEVIGKIDALSAKARLAEKLDADVPETPFGERITIRQGKNPVLLLKEKNEDVVPFTLDYGENERCVVITGPNAGGKSVTLKTVGLLSMMLQSGYPIPADEQTELPIFTRYFIDVGDDQSIENDLSTFSSRLALLKQMLDHADDKSLILIDEAGTGTDPDEGSALYQAALETFMKRSSTMVVTTHHGKIKAFVHDHPQAVNASMEFSQEELRPTYRFKKGAPGSSYAFEIADTMQISKSLLERARDHMGEKKSSLEDLILDLEREQQQVFELKQELDRKKKEAAEKEKAYKNKYEEFTEQREAYRKKARSEAQEIVDEANAKIEMVVQAIVESNASKESIKEAHKTVDGLKKVLKEEREKSEAKEAEKQDYPDVGDNVKLKDSGATGELVALNGKKAEVMMNGLKVKTKLNNLERQVATKENKKKRRFMKSRMADTSGAQRATGNKLELRGKRVHEVQAELPTFIDRAVMSGLNEVEIIHGKGTGALRQTVRDYLKQDSRVASFGDAPWDQGGPGCTLAQLK